MKKNPAPHAALSYAALVMLIILLLALPTQKAAALTIAFTEVSSTALTVIDTNTGLPIGTVNPAPTDAWAWSYTTSIPRVDTNYYSLSYAQNIMYEEPEDPATVNVINASWSPSSDGVYETLWATISSDVPLAGLWKPYPIQSNGAQFPWAAWTIDSATPPYPTVWSYDLSFTDNGDIAAVPEPSTMILLGSGLIGLAGYGRKKFFKK